MTIYEELCVIEKNAELHVQKKNLMKTLTNTRITRLVALLMKGDPRDPANYRYHHLRSDLARIFEAVVYLKLEDHFATNTAEPQQGGLKECETVENLTTLIYVINQREREGSGIITNFIDAVQFFDKCFLSDTQAVLVLQNADKKAVKVLQKFQETNHIHVQGSSEKFIIKDGEGQGHKEESQIRRG